MKNILFLSTFLSILVGCNVETLTAEVPKEAAPQAEVLPVLEAEEVKPDPIEEKEEVVVSQDMGLEEEKPVLTNEAVEEAPNQPSKLGKIVGYSALGLLGVVLTGHLSFFLRKFMRRDASYSGGGGAPYSDTSYIPESLSL